MSIVTAFFSLSGPHCIWRRRCDSDTDTDGGSTNNSVLLDTEIVFDKIDTDTHVCGIDNDDKQLRYGCFVVISTRRENEEEEKDLFFISQVKNRRTCCRMERRINSYFFLSSSLFIHFNK